MHVWSRENLRSSFACLGATRWPVTGRPILQTYSPGPLPPPGSSGHSLGSSPPAPGKGNNLYNLIQNHFHLILWVERWTMGDKKYFVSYSHNPFSEKSRYRRRVYKGGLHVRTSTSRDINSLASWQIFLVDSLVSVSTKGSITPTQYLPAVPEAVRPCWVQEAQRWKASQCHWRSQWGSCPSSRT